MSSKPIGPDNLCESFDRSVVKLRIDLLDKSTVLIESDKEGLIFLGQLLVEMANAEDDGFQLAPSGPGKLHFSKKSRFGLYIHRIDE